MLPPSSILRFSADSRSYFSSCNLLYSMIGLRYDSCRRVSSCYMRVSNCLFFDSRSELRPLASFSASSFFSSSELIFTSFCRLRALFSAISLLYCSRRSARDVSVIALLHCSSFANLSSSCKTPASVVKFSI